MEDIGGNSVGVGDQDPPPISAPILKLEYPVHKPETRPVRIRSRRFMKPTPESVFEMQDFHRIHDENHVPNCDIQPLSRHGYICIIGKSDTLETEKTAQASSPILFVRQVRTKRYIRNPTGPSIRVKKRQGATHLCGISFLDESRTSHAPMAMSNTR